MIIIKRDMRQDRRSAPKAPINENITAREVRLIGADGEQVGIVSIDEALQLAAGLEYYPWGNNYLRLHAFYDWISTISDRHALEIGVTWRFDLYKRK